MKILKYEFLEVWRKIRGKCGHVKKNEEPTFGTQYSISSHFCLKKRATLRMFMILKLSYSLPLK